MAVETRKLDGSAGVVSVSGRLVLGGETEKLDAAVNSLIAQGCLKVILDITALDYADSAGVGMLVACLTNVKKSGGEMRIAGANPRIQRILTMTGVVSLMPMFDTLAAATS
jgi:anti-anti-sigma factor